MWNVLHTSETRKIDVSIIYELGHLRGLGETLDGHCLALYGAWPSVS